MNEHLTPRRDYDRRRRLGLGIVAAVLACLSAAGCHRAAPPKGDRTIEVVVSSPIAGEVTAFQDFTGRLDSLLTVDVRPRVSGYVMQAPFKEGDLVEEGDLLFEIDPRTYKSDLDQAEANLRQAEAESKLQVQRAARARKLIANNSIAPEDYEQTVALRDKAIATVSSMKAARDRAQLFLGFTRVLVPSLRKPGAPDKRLQGRVSRRMVDPGNLVNADQTILTTIVTEDQMYAYFDVDERTYLKLKTLTSGSTSWFSSLNFPVLMRLAHEEKFQQMGHVNFLDNRLNGNTGTVRMRALFDNPHGILKSGLFTRIRLPIGVPQKTLLISDEALQSDQGRKFVYVVKKEMNDKGKEVDRVEYRAVELGQSIEGLRSIEKGLQEGERVIITGMQRVKPGAEVQAQWKEPPAAPVSPLTKMLKSASKQ